MARYRVPTLGFDWELADVDVSVGSDGVWRLRLGRLRVE